MHRQDALAGKVALSRERAAESVLRLRAGWDKWARASAICGRRFREARTNRPLPVEWGWPVRPNLFEVVSPIGMLEYLILMEKIAETQSHSRINRTAMEPARVLRTPRRAGQTSQRVGGRSLGRVREQ